MDPILEAALQYIDSGLSILPVNPRDKRPVSAILPSDKSGNRGWGQLQKQIASQAVVKAWFATNGHGLGIIGGRVSGGLEVLDFDAPELFAPWVSIVQGIAPGLIERLPQVRTPRGGYHVYFRCAVTRGNQKLAERLNDEQRRETLIETRGEGGYVQAPPSPNYRLISGDLLNIPTITPDERDILLQATRTFHQVNDTAKTVTSPNGGTSDGRAGDDFNARGDWRSVLQKHGWAHIFTHGTKEFWRRPGKDDRSWSATWNYSDCGRLYIFSSNADPFEPEHSYSPFAVYALLEHGGDYSRAAKELYAQGFGSQTTEPPKPCPASVGQDDDGPVGLDGWRTLHDAYLEKPPRQYLVGKMLPLPSLSILFGNPGSLKTLLLMDLAMCVVSGQDWLPGLNNMPDADPFACARAPVLWIDIDNGFDRLERRWLALGKAHNVSEDEPLRYTSFPNPPFLANSAESIQWLIHAVIESGARLVILDNLGTISGAADENSAEMITVMSGLRQVAENCGVAVVVIHHKTKGKAQRRGDALRGHSSIEGAIDLGLMVEREDGDDSITLWSTKSRDSVIEPFCAMWTFDRDKDDELVSGMFYGLGRPEKSSGTANKARDAILQVFNAGMTQSHIVDAVKNCHQIGRNSTLSALNTLVREQILRAETGGARNTVCYYPGRLQKI